MTWQTDLYDEMVADVVTYTNRRDQVGEIEIAMRTATQNAHLVDMFFRDKVTTQVQLPNGSVQFAIDIPTMLPGLRGLVDIRPCDLNGNVLYTDTFSNSSPIEIVENNDIYDPQYGNVKPNIAYVSGSNLIIRYPISIGGFIVEYARAPQTRRELYNSWIAQEVPAIITFWASAIIFSTNGNQEKAQSLLKQIQDFFIPQLKQNYLLAKMR